MTRNYGRIKTSIWADDDFRSLSDSAQALYLRLLSASTMNLCGVCDWRPKRLALLTAGMTVEKVEESAAELSKARYIVIDEGSDEVLVRTFIRHENVIQNPKTAAGAEAAFSTIVSARLRSAVAYEMRRLRLEIPDLKGWDLVPIALRFAIDWLPDWVSDRLSDNQSAEVDRVSDWESDQASDRVPIHQEPFTKNHEPGTGSRPATVRPMVQQVLADFAAWLEETGNPLPPRPLRNQLSTQVHDLLADGQPPSDILAGLQLWQGKGANLGAGLLPNLVHEARSRPSPAKPRRQADTDDIFDKAANWAAEQDRKAIAR